jgi:hypothetical protein
VLALGLGAAQDPPSVGGGLEAAMAAGIRTGRGRARPSHLLRFLVATDVAAALGTAVPQPA